MLSDLKDRVKAQADLAAIIGEHTGLRKTGASRFVGRCPFHSEKTPSFHVDNAKNGGVYHCKGCQASGDVFTFWQKIHGLQSFPETVESLAEHLHIPFERRELETSPAEAAERSRVRELDARLVAVV